MTLIVSIINWDGTLAAAGKDRRKIVTAVGRELLGFIWAIGIKAEKAAAQRRAA
jgi:transposase